MLDAKTNSTGTADLDAPRAKFRFSARTMLMLDWAGAWLTAFSVGFLLATQVVPTGIPTSILILMATAAFGFGVVDGVGLICFRKLSPLLATDRDLKSRLLLFLDWSMPTPHSNIDESWNRLLRCRIRDHNPSSDRGMANRLSITLGFAFRGDQLD